MLGLLQFRDKLLDQIVPLFDQLLVSLVKLVLIKQVNGLILVRLKRFNFGLLSCKLVALTRDYLFVVEDVLRGALVFELLYEVFKLCHAFD